MCLDTAEDGSAAEIHLPAEIDWHMLDKSKFFFLGAGLFSGVSAALYPIIVLKTRQQVSPTKLSCFKMSYSIIRHEGFRGFYRGYGTSLMGTIPARALYMGSLEITKSSVGSATVRFGFSDTSAMAMANAAAGLTAAMAAQLVWTPVDVVSQRLMVQGSNNGSKNIVPCLNSFRYSNGIDAFRKIINADGLRGLYRGFGMSIMTYAPSNAVWWASYSVAYKHILNGLRQRRISKNENSEVEGNGYGWFKPDSKTVVGVQGLSAAMASGVSAIITMPLDTIKTRLQVLDGEENGQRRPLTAFQTVKNLVKEGGLTACYRGLGPRWASMAMSATTMITTYEFVKQLSAKNQGSSLSS